MTEIVMTVGSSSKGTVGFSELNIDYDAVINVNTNGLVSALNAVIENSDELEALVEFGLRLPIMKYNHISLYTFI